MPYSTGQYSIGKPWVPFSSLFCMLKIFFRMGLFWCVRIVDFHFFEKPVSISEAKAKITCLTDASWSKHPYIPFRLICYHAQL